MRWCFFFLSPNKKYPVEDFWTCIILGGLVLGGSALGGEFLEV